MPSSPKSAAKVARAVLGVLRSGPVGGGRRKGLALLEERDASGQPLGTRVPYTDEAIREFESAYARDPEDFGLVHHLAIAHHARAWDWELAGNPEAPGEWELALTFWRRLETSREFWAGLQARYRVLAGDNATSDWLKAERAGLLDGLLEVHAAFICRYTEIGEPSRALAHIALVRRAGVPPVARDRLIAKVFAFISGPVLEALARGDNHAALSGIRRFLGLIPDHLPALRLLMEIHAAWLGQASYDGHWEEIFNRSQDVKPWAERLLNHQGLGSDPLARSALLNLGVHFLRLANKRGAAGLQRLREGERTDSVEMGVTGQALDLGVGWGRLLGSTATAGSNLRDWWVECLKGLAVHWKLRGDASAHPGMNVADLITIRDCFEHSRAVVLEAIQVNPADRNLVTGFLEPIEEQIAQVRAHLECAEN